MSTTELYDKISNMKKIATDIYMFLELRKNGFAYVDKTDALFCMASGESGKQFFIERPRRFGGFLAVSTLKALFEGRRELFDGLAIEPKLGWSKKWTILHLDMGSMQAPIVVEFRELLVRQPQRKAGESGMVVNVPGDVYIVEFKLDRPALEALEQIKEKDYAEKYALLGRRTTLIDISFSSEKRTSVEELVECLGVA